MTAIAHLIKPKPKINWLKNRHDWLDSLLDYFWKIVLRRVIQITQSRWLRSCYKLSVNHWQFSKIGEEAAGGSEELKFFIAFIVSAVTASWYALLVSAPFNCWRNRWKVTNPKTICKTPNRFSKKEGKPTIFSEILGSKNIDLIGKDKCGKTPYMNACISGHTDDVKLQLNYMYVKMRDIFDDFQTLWPR